MQHIRIEGLRLAFAPLESSISIESILVALLQARLDVNKAFVLWLGAAD
jgi:hypothetical protein